MVGTALGAVEVAVGLLTIVGIVGGAYHRFAIVPVQTEADDAMSTAREAKQLAESNRDELDALDEDLRQSLDELSSSVAELVDGMEQQRREYRGQSYQVYLLAKAMNESDSTPDVPVPDEDEFLRGGEKASFRTGDD